jgi:molybdopterin synthase catalytic subunit
MKIAVQQEVFDEGEELAALRGAGVGAIASFTGLVRGDGDIAALELEHYPLMTEKALRHLAERAMKRWGLLGVTIIHRVGRLAAGAPIVFVGCACAHRSDAIDACAFLIDTLKTDAPFWKREIKTSGEAAWVEAKAQDRARADVWRG